MSLVLQKRKNEKGFSLYLEGKLIRRHLGLRWTLTVFRKKSELRKLQMEGRAKTFGRSKIQDFSTCCFPITPITYSMGEEHTFFTDTSKYTRINLVQKALWLSAFLYLPHICSTAGVLLLSWSLKLSVCPRRNTLPLSRISGLICMYASFPLTDTLTIVSLDNFDMDLLTVFAVITERAGFTYTELLCFSKGIPVTGNGRN